MKLVRFTNPYYNVNKNLVNDLFNSFLYNDTHACNCGPATNVMETENDFRIEVSLPGFTKKDVNVNIEKDLLTIKSDVTRENEIQNQYTRREFSTFSFEKKFQLPDTVDAEKIEARFENGILTLTLPKKEVTVNKPVSIDIQ